MGIVVKIRTGFVQSQMAVHSKSQQHKVYATIVEDHLIYFPALCFQIIRIGIKQRHMVRRDLYDRIAKQNFSTRKCYHI